MHSGGWLEARSHPKSRSAVGRLQQLPIRSPGRRALASSLSARHSLSGSSSGRRVCAPAGRFSSSPGSFYFFRLIIQNIFFAAGIIRETKFESPIFVSLAEMTAFLALVGAMALMALFEGRRILDYNLSGPHRLASFCVRAVLPALSRSLCSWERWHGVAGCALQRPRSPAHAPCVLPCCGAAPFFSSVWSRRACSVAMLSSRSRAESISGGRLPRKSQFAFTPC